MSISRSIIPVLLFLIACLQAAPVFAFNGRHLTDSDQERLVAGEPLVDIKSAGDNTVVIAAAIDIPARREIVWKILTDCENSPDYLPNLTSCRVLKRSTDGHEDVREFIGDWGLLLPSLRSVVRSGYDKPKRIRFETLDGDFSELSGEWRFEPVGQNTATRVIYLAKVAMPALIPSFVALDFIESDIPQTLNALRKEVLNKSVY